MQVNSNKTVRELINEVSFKFAESDLYYGHGTDNAFDEAVYLVFSVLDIPYDIEDEKLNNQIDQESCQKIESLASRRITERKPIAYLVNKAWFSGIPFYIDERVLVPRSPLAELIENRFSPWVKKEQQLNHILDIGTGSGCIAVALAKAFPQVFVDAIDISTEALDVARVNVEFHKLDSRINLINSDLFENLQGKKYDLIITNPPYVTQLEMKQLPEEYCHEPILGLFAGDDGLDYVRTIINASPNYLNEGGMLFVEVGNGQTAIEKAYPDLPFTWLEFERGGEGVFLLNANDLLLATEDTEFTEINKK